MGIRLGIRLGLGLGFVLSVSPEVHVELARAARHAHFRAVALKDPLSRLEHHHLRLGLGLGLGLGVA